MSVRTQFEACVFSVSTKHPNEIKKIKNKLMHRGAISVRTRGHELKTLIGIKEPDKKL